MSIMGRGKTCGKVVHQEGAKYILRPERGLEWLEQRVRAISLSMGEREVQNIQDFVGYALEFILILRAKRLRF